MGGGDGGGDGGGGDGGDRQATLSWAYWCTAVQRRPPSELTCTARSRPSRQSSPAKPTAGGALPLHVMRSESIFVTGELLRREAVRPAVDVDDAADEAVAHQAVADDAERELVRVARRRVADARVVQHEARVLDDLRRGGGRATSSTIWNSAHGGPTVGESSSTMPTSPPHDERPSSFMSADEKHVLPGQLGQALETSSK